MIRKKFQKVFKKVSYSFFFKLYGIIDHSIKSTDDKRIEVNKINKGNNINYNIYVIQNGRLYTDRIHDAAAIIDNKIIEGASFQLRDGPNKTMQYSKVEDNIVFRKGTPRFLKKLDGNVLSLLTGGGGNNNYWHWLYDVLPKVYLCNEFVSLNNVDFFLLPSTKRKFQNETLDSLKIPMGKRLSSENFRHIKTKKLIVTDHPVITTGNATKDIQNIPEWIILWLRETFLQNVALTNKKRIYIDRNDDEFSSTSLRSINNEKEVKDYLLKHDFSIVKLHKTHFSEQVSLFNNAEYVVGLHGAGFANISFCKPGTKIIEIKSPTSGDVIKNLAKKNSLNYKSIVSEYTEKPNFDFPTQQGNIHVSINNLIQEFKK